MSDDVPFSRETGLFVSAGEDGEETRLHQREGGKWFFHRWRLRRDFYTGEPLWIGPWAFSLTAGEIYDAAEALRRQVDATKTAAKGAKK